MNYKDNKRANTAEELRRMFNLDGLSSDRKAIQNNKNSLTKIDSEQNNILKSIIISVGDSLESQSEISLWFFSGTPTLENVPYIDWNDKEEHLGDLYYDKEKGYVYLFEKIDNEYIWTRKYNNELIQAMSLTNAELDTTDNVRKVFFTTPTVPYDNGDWYVKDGDLYICQISKDVGETYEENDFIIAPKYTDDTRANEVAGNLTIVAGQVTTIIQSLSVISQQIEDNRYYIDEHGERKLISTSMSTLEQTVDQVQSTVTQDILDQDTKISQITQTVDELNSKISDIADITISGESNFATFTLDGINQSEPITIRVKPIDENISYLYPNSNLYPSSNLFSKVRTIRFHNNTTNTNIDYVLPDNLLYYSNTVYDEFYLDYDSQICRITKRCQYNADGTVSPLAQEQTVNYPYPTISLTDGDYTLSLIGYEYGYLFVRLMAQNIYTSQFYTKVETDSKISQTADNIYTEVRRKVGDDEVISKINQSAEAITINANKVNLQGYITATDLSGSGTTTINGSNITTGTIDASRVNVTNINASNITSGTISASKISGGTLSGQTISGGNINGTTVTGGTITGTIISNGNNFNVDRNGNMSCNNAQLKGIFKNYSNNGKLAVEIANTNINLYDYQGSESLAGTLASVRGTSDNIIGVNLFTYSGNKLTLGYKSSPSSSTINSIIQFDTNNLNSTPWVINASSGTLFPSNPNGGIIVENGFIKNWNLKTITTDIVLGAGRYKFVNGLLVEFIRS